MRLNPWVAAPVALGGAAGGVLGWVVARATCLPETCLGRQVLFGAAGTVLAMAGIGVLVVLAVLSLSEWRRLKDRDNGDRESERHTDAS